MGKIILGLFFFVTIVIVSFLFVVGFLRRMLGKLLGSAEQRSELNKKDPRVVYDKDGVQVFKGDANDVG